jgi:hypothetical protein
VRTTRILNKDLAFDEDRTSGLGPAERKEHYLTAAPFHRFDGVGAILFGYDSYHFLAVAVVVVVVVAGVDLVGVRLVHFVDSGVIASAGTYDVY